MVDSSNLIGLYIIVPIYFCFLFAAAIWGMLRMRRHKKKLDAEGAPEDSMTSHYLGGRSFSGFLTAGTMFASFFSGYTVVGVPNEAYKTGFLSLRWLTTAAIVGVGYFGTAARLRKTGLVRNHQSPVDFINDRFRSQFLRYTAVTLQVFPSIIYLTAQCTAIHTTFNSIFRLEPDNYGPVIAICAIILLFEFMGGMSCVALTDAVQGFTMVICFFTIPIIIKKNFGGWADLDLATYPRQDFYRTPTSSQQWLFWNFTVVNFCFFSLPHFLQRIYSAKSLGALKMGFKFVTLGPWLTMLTGTFIGTVGVQMLADAGIDSPKNPFGAILTVIMDMGGFPYFAACITFTAALAAIMSTADSILLAISHVFTAEVVYPLWPNATPRRVTIFGRIVSFLSISVALAISILGGKNLSDLAAIQFGLSLQLLPVFMLGLFATQSTECHPYSIAAGAWAGFATTFSIHYSYMKGYNPEIDGPPFNSGVMGVAMNFCVIVLVEGLFRIGNRTSDAGAQVKDETEMFVGEDVEVDKVHPSLKAHKCQPEWDVPHNARFGDVALTSELVWRCMEGVREPIVEHWFGLLIFVLTLTMTPLVGGGDPPLNADGTLAYPPSTVRGLPAWAINTIAFTALTTLVVYWAIGGMPDDYPEIDETKEDVDPNTLSLTSAELGQRSSYDGVNASARLRRSSLIRASQVNAVESSIIQKKIEEEVPEEESA